MEEPEFGPDLLRLAYQQGYFPMPHPDTGEILWLHPDPRAIIPLDGLHTSRSLQRTMRRTPFEITIDKAFAEVMDACGDRKETWIDERFKLAYQALHADGDAHSLEVWLDGKLVGGLYGVSINGAFFAESMFHRATDASKVALYHLVTRLKERSMALLEVQFITPHLASLGAIEVPRFKYMQMLRMALMQDTSFV